MSWGSKRKRFSPRDKKGPQLGRETRYEWVKVKNILLPQVDDELDEKVVADIAESILLFDLLHPLVVRWHASP
jgi:hypothetical protein